MAAVLMDLDTWLPAPPGPSRIRPLSEHLAQATKADSEDLEIFPTLTHLSYSDKISASATNRIRSMPFELVHVQY
jgi:hypothetical protein